MLSVARRLPLAGVALAMVTALAALIPSPAHGLSVLSFSSGACTNISSTSSLSNLCFNGLPQTSQSFDSSPAQSEWTVPNVSANAFQSPFGYDRARADAAATLDVAAAAAAVFTLKVQNDEGGPIPLSFRFFISNAELALTLGNYVAAADDLPQAEIRSSVLTVRGGGPVTQINLHWAYRAVLGSGNSQVLIGLQDSLNFVDPQGIGKLGIDEITQTLGSTRVDFDPFFGELDLGMLDPNEIIELAYQIDARVYTGVHDPSTNSFPDPPTVAGSALIEDPFSLESGFFLNGQSLASLLAPTQEPPSGVPAPGTWLLVGIGVGAFAAWRRKQP